MIGRYLRVMARVTTAPRTRHSSFEAPARVDEETVQAISLLGTVLANVKSNDCSRSWFAI